ncbi:MAG: amino acid ABC transporter permease/ATP-binding protein [Actinomycetota bacterium]|nr:amino acid ABC transporter permease/ATP-binding protein [Actinomycetota bacterium]
MTFLHQLAHYLTFHFLLQGLVITLVISAGSLVGAILLGGGLAGLQMSGRRSLSLPARAYSSVFRGTPLILQLVFFYDALPHIGITLSATVTAIVVFSLNESTFFAEIFRGGVSSVGRGQVLAAQSLGMTPRQVMRHVVGPQAFRVMLPMLGNEMVGLIKNTSLASVISVNELTLRSESLVAQNFAFFPVFFASGLMYLVLTSAVAAGQAIAEWRLGLEGPNRRKFGTVAATVARLFPPVAARGSEAKLPGGASATGGVPGDDSATIGGDGNAGAAMAEDRARHRRDSVLALAAATQSEDRERAQASGLDSGAARPSPNLVEIRGVTKSYGQKRVLEQVDFTVAEGEVVVLMGASGSGKSTLLRLINHLEALDSGSISVAGRQVGYSSDGVPMTGRLLAKARAEAGISMVFQHFELFSHKTALENVTLAPMVVQGRQPSRVLPAASALLGAVGLSDRSDVLPGRLSGGQQQRVAIARALSVHPRVVLFDEPTSALDPELVGEVLETIRELAEAGMTMLVVTHEVRFAKEVADRVVFMAEGRIVEQGPPTQVLDTPRDPRTRRFLRMLEEPEHAGGELVAQEISG